MAIIWIKLEINGDADEAMDAVDSALDNGDLQDAINERLGCDDSDAEAEGAVVSAVADLDPQKLASEHAAWRAQEERNTTCGGCGWPRDAESKTENCKYGSGCLCGSVPAPQEEEKETQDG